MNDFDTLLDATVRELEAMKAAGVRHVAVSRDTLAALAIPSSPQPPARTANQQRSPSAAPVSPAQPATPRIEVPPPPPPPSGVPQADKAAALGAIRARAMACVQCPHLVASRKQVVFGVGNPGARLMFVGEAPGADEDAQGEPFVGAAGQLLTKIIQAMGLSRGDVYIANILKCRPDMPAGSSGNRKPTLEELHTCSPWLLEQIDVIRPHVMVALGATAVEGLLGKTVGITRLRGSWHAYRGTPLMPTFHPAYLLRNQALSEKRKVWEDMLAVMARLDMPISEKQRNFFLRAQGS